MQKVSSCLRDFCWSIALKPCLYASAEYIQDPVLDRFQRAQQAIHRNNILRRPKADRSVHVEGRAAVLRKIQLPCMADHLYDWHGNLRESSQSYSFSWGVLSSRWLTSRGLGPTPRSDSRRPYMR